MNKFLQQRTFLQLHLKHDGVRPVLKQQQAQDQTFCSEIQREKKKPERK